MKLTRQQRDRLFRLAERYGVLTHYLNVDDERQEASPDALIALLQAYGVELNSPEDIAVQEEQRRREEWARPIVRTLVAWDGELEFDLRLDASAWPDTVTATIELESGEERTIDIFTRDAKRSGAARFDDCSIFGRHLVWGEELPLGYHQLRVDYGGSEPASALVIAAPRLAHLGPDRPMWGLFLPTYAIRTDDPGHWGAGNFSDLESFLDWIQSTGGDIAGTLPMLAAYLDDPFDPSPYAPVSRLFWNEFMVDVTRLQEYQRSDKAQSIVDDREFQAEVERLRRSDLVDYREGMQLRRHVLFTLAQHCFDEDGERLQALHQWMKSHPLAGEYARFRAMVECYGPDWSSWPIDNPGELPEESPDIDIEQYHLFAQWAASSQMDEIAQEARKSGWGLYIDLPIGVHPQGYDAWRYADHFVQGVAVGAPPDPTHTKGQNWGFEPLSPEAMERHGFRYFIDVIRHHMDHAATLRIDHVMGLHRQFWIPEGFEASKGIYMRYNPDALYAILTLESQRHKTVIVGENLGTVPKEVPVWMHEHGMSGMSVLPFLLDRSPDEISDLPLRTLATFNTHDMPPFRVFWDSLDAESKEQLNEAFKEAAIVTSDVEDPEQALSASLQLLATSKAHIVLINLEDLWLETHQQNVPGTTVDEYPDWQQKARYTLDELDQQPEVLKALDTMRFGRNQAVDEVVKHFRDGDDHP